MKKTPILFAVVLWVRAMCVAAQVEGTSKIQFSQTIYDFGKISQVATVSGVFKFKNVGDGILKLEPPRTSRGCTVSELKPDTLQPGETGELPFTVNLGSNRATVEKHIAVRSNDPQTPVVFLTAKVHYTPLFDLNPITLVANLPLGTKETTEFATYTRTDGKLLRIARLEASKPWITATVEPSAQADEATVRIRVAIRRDGPPRRFNEYVRIYTAGQTNTPASNIYVYGQIMGEVSLSAEALYWSVTDAAETPIEGMEALIPRRVTIRSDNGQMLELKNLQSTIKGIKVELVPKEDGKLFELVARLDEVPASSVSGIVSFETSVAAQSRIEIPLTVYVFKP
ncbi:MAG: DUF1573 domain-containing protein [Verrucomicrobia bacterium]|nr:DUF1573 domain-containing protein [Verrucomicrobiota bacterium]